MGTQVYNLDGAGNTITSTLTGTSRGLDVNLVNPGAVGGNVGINAASNTVSAVQSGAWSATVGIAAGSNTVSAVQSGGWNVGINAASNTVSAVQSGGWNVGIAGASNTVSAVQSGAWTVSLGASTTISAVQSGVWTVGASLTTKDVFLSGTASVQGTVGISGTVSAFITNTGTAAIPSHLSTVTATSPLPITMAARDVFLSGTASVAGNVGLTSGSQTIGAAVVSGTSTAALPTYLQVGRVVDDSGTTRTVLYTMASLTAPNTTTVIVAAPGANLKIHVLGCMAVVNATSSAYFLDGNQSLSTKLAGAAVFQPGGGFVFQASPVGQFVCSSNTAPGVIFNSGTAADFAVKYITASA